MRARRRYPPFDGVGGSAGVCQGPYCPLPGWSVSSGPGAARGQGPRTPSCRLLPPLHCPRCATKPRYDLSLEGGGGSGGGPLGTSLPPPFTLRTGAAPQDNAAVSAGCGGLWPQACAGRITPHPPISGVVVPSAMLSPIAQPPSQKIALLPPSLKFYAFDWDRGQGCIRREGASEVAPEAVRQAVGGGCRSGWGRLLSVINAIEASTWRQGDSSWA